MQRSATLPQSLSGLMGCELRCLENSLSLGCGVQDLGLHGSRFTILGFKEKGLGIYIWGLSDVGFRGYGYAKFGSTGSNILNTTLETPPNLLRMLSGMQPASPGQEEAEEVAAAGEAEGVKTPKTPPQEDSLKILNPQSLNNPHVPTLNISRPPATTNPLFTYSHQVCKENGCSTARGGLVLMYYGAK